MGGGKNQSSMKNITSYSLIYGLAILSGFAYLTGFWLPFNFNFIEHIDISGIIKISAFSMIPVLVMMLIGAGLGSVTATRHVENIIKSKNGDVNLAIETTSFRVVNHTFTAITIAVCLLSTPFIISPNLTERLLGAFPIASVITLFHFTKNPGPLRELNSFARAITLTVACIFPTASILTGYVNGLNSVNNHSPGFLLKNTDSCSSDSENKFRYISTSGEKLIALSLGDNSICVTTAKSFSLVPYNPQIDASKNSNLFIEKYKTLIPLKFIFQSKEIIEATNK